MWNKDVCIIVLIFISLCLDGYENLFLDTCLIWCQSTSMRHEQGKFKQFPQQKNVFKIYFEEIKIFFFL